MSCLGVLFAIDSATSKRLRTASADEVMEIVGEVEEEWAEDFVMETDKAWDAIHRALSDGTLDPDGGEYPLNRAILGGEHLETDEEYIVALVPKEDVPAVAKALAGIDENDFRRRYETTVPKDYAPEYGEEDLASSCWGPPVPLAASQRASPRENRRCAPTGVRNARRFS